MDGKYEIDNVVLDWETIGAGNIVSLKVDIRVQVAFPVDYNILVYFQDRLEMESVVFSGVIHTNIVNEEVGNNRAPRSLPEAWCNGALLVVVLI